MRKWSGRYFVSGRQLSEREYRYILRSAREEEVAKRIREYWMSFRWLARALRLPQDFDLSGMVKRADFHGSASFYQAIHLTKKANGSPRIIIPPKPALKKVQKRIHRLLMRTFPRPEHSFGYRGGTCLEVAQRHVDWPSTLKFDVRDAFFQVSWTKVRSAIKRPRYNELDQPQPPGFSGPVAHWIAKLCTYSPPPQEVYDLIPHSGYWRASSFLPQGAPTSSVLFDLACAKLDAKLLRLAERVGGRMSRYADNYYFSMPTPEISEKLERIIVCEAEKHGFPVHKVRRVSQGELCKILGYNLVNGRITNTRDFNRNLRGALHVLETRLERGLEWEEAYRRVQGFMSFAVNTPQNLLETWAHCQVLREEAIERWAATIPF